MEQNSIKKSFYIFLTSLLGILLFVTIQKSISLIGIILLNVDYSFYSLGTNPLQVHALNIATMMLALFLGGWYGVWIGLHWYRAVYEQGQNGLLHGLSGGLFHRPPSVSQKHVVRTVRQAAPVPKKPIVHQRISKVDGVGENSGSWEFDDLLVRRQMAARAIPEEEVVVAPKPKRRTRTVKKTVSESEPASLPSSKVSRTRSRAKKTKQVT